MATLVVMLFMASGAAALAYEVVWVRALGLVVGNSLWAAIAVVAAYMGGMALGSWWAARVLARLRAHLRAYAALEACAAIWALATPLTLPWLQRLAAHLGPEPLSSWGLPLLGRFAVAWLFLAVPTVSLGATLPILVGRLPATDLGLSLARLYAANTIGAVFGTLGAGFLGLPFVGERGTMGLAASLGILVAVAAWFLEERIPRQNAAQPTGKGNPEWYLAYPFLFGFVSLSLELVWTRVLLLHLGSRVYAFTLVLSVYLLGLALGGAISRFFVARGRQALAWWQMLLAFSLLAQLILLARFSGLLGWLALCLRPTGFLSLALTLATAVALLLLLPTVAFGASFPLSVAVAPGRASGGEQTGLLAASNTLGAITGTLVGPLGLVPFLGTQKVLVLFAALAALLAVLLFRSRVLVASAGVVWVACGVALLWLPAGLVLGGAAVLQDGTVEEVKESAAGTIIVRQVRDARGSWRSLEINGVNVAGTSPELWSIQRLQGHLPLLLHRYPRKVLHIGFGSGGTAWAVSRHRSVEEIVVAEISPEVLAMSHRLFGDVNHGVLQDRRVRVLVNDGRNVLLATNETFDAILSDSIHPVFAGNSTLYTREYFELCRQRLNPGGVVSMWLPLYSLRTDSYLAILRAFWEVFPTTIVWYDLSVVNEFTVVTGFLERGPVHLRWSSLADPEVAATLAEAGVRGVDDLASLLLLGPQEVAELVASVLPHRDDYPEVEYLSGRLLEREASWLANFELLVRSRCRQNPFAGYPGDWERVRTRRDQALVSHLAALERRVSSR